MWCHVIVNELNVPMCIRQCSYVYTSVFLCVDVSVPSNNKYFSYNEYIFE